MISKSEGYNAPLFKARQMFIVCRKTE